MLKNICFAFLFFTSGFYAWSDTIFVESRITNATVFPNGVEVTRSSTSQIPKGTHVLVFDELPYEISPDEYQIKSSDVSCIVSKKIIKNRGRWKGKSEAVKVLEKQIDDLITESQDIESHVFVLERKKMMLLENSTVHKTNEGIQFEKLNTALKFVEGKLNDIREERKTYKRKLKEINEQIIALRSKIQKHVKAYNKDASLVYVSVDVSTSQSLSFELMYYLKSAGWRPNYNLKVEDVNKPLAMEFQAEVFQSTGEHWKDITIQLNESKPIKQDVFPEFQPYYLENGLPTKKKNKTTYSKVQGIIGDATTGALLPFSEVVFMRNGQLYKQVLTDALGRFKINPIQTGEYSVSVNQSGYVSAQKKIYIKADREETLEIGLGKKEETGLVFAEDIKNIPVRGVSRVVANTGGVSQSDRGSSLSVRGGRSGQTTYFVDGVKVIGTPPSNVYNGSHLRSKETIHIANETSQNDLQRSYIIKTPQTLESNGEEYVLRIKTIEVPVEYEYLIMAHESTDAFIRGQINGFNQYHLFNGKANVYFQGQYVGETVVNTHQNSDTLSLFLGIDKQVVVERSKYVLSNKIQFSNGKVKSDIEVGITLKNTKSVPVKVSLVDQLPISNYKEVDISIEQLDDAKLEPKTGKLTWNLVLNPKESKLFSIKYYTKHNRNFDVFTD